MPSFSSATYKAVTNDLNWVAMGESAQFLMHLEGQLEVLLRVLAVQRIVVNQLQPSKGRIVRYLGQWMTQALE